MPRADYYILSQSDYESRELMACRLCEKAISQGQRVQILFDDEALLDQLDRRLWSFRSDAFIPHERRDSSRPAPVQLTTEIHPDPDQEILINLAQSSPELADQFSRVIEIVSQDPKVLSATRESYRSRRAQGWELNRFDQRSG